jgi:hypothetical protein
VFAVGPIILASLEAGAVGEQELDGNENRKKVETHVRFQVRISIEEEGGAGRRHTTGAAE